MKFTLTPEGNAIFNWRNKKGEEKVASFDKRIAQVDIDNITLAGDGFIVKLYVRVDDLDISYKLLGKSFSKQTEVVEHIKPKVKE